MDTRHPVLQPWIGSAEVREELEGGIGEREGGPRYENGNKTTTD